MTTMRIFFILATLFTALLALNAELKGKKPGRGRHCKPRPVCSSSSSSSSSSSCSTSIHGCCDPEEAIEVVRKMVKQWPDYINTGNSGYLIKHWILPDASISVTGDPIIAGCDTRIEPVVDHIQLWEEARINWDIVNIKTIKYRRDGTVLAVFVIAAGVKGHNLALYNESWLFYPRQGCDYALAEASEIRVGCLDQNPDFCFNDL